MIIKNRYESLSERQYDTLSPEDRRLYDESRDVIACLLTRASNRPLVLSEREAFHRMKDIIYSLKEGLEEKAA